MELTTTFFFLIFAFALTVQGFDIAGLEIPLPELDIPELPELEMPEFPELEMPEFPELPDLSDITGMLNPESVADIPNNVPDVSDSVSTVQSSMQNIPEAASTVQGAVQSIPGKPAGAEDTTTSTTTDSSRSTTTVSSKSTTDSTSSTTDSSSSTTVSSSSTTTKAPSKTTIRDFSSSLIPYQSTKVKESVKRCKENVSITTEEILSIIRKEVPKTEEGECFLACIKKENGLITEDNKYNMERVKYVLDPVKTSNEKLYQKVVKIFEECKNSGLNEEDDCEAGKKLRKCVQNKRNELKR